MLQKCFQIFSLVLKVCVVFITLFHNVLNCNKSILVHFRPTFVFTELSHILFNIMLNINLMTSETVNKRKISLCIATKLIRPNKGKSYELKPFSLVITSKTSQYTSSKNNSSYKIS